MIHMKDLVSVIITVHNQETEIEDTILSICNQYYDNVEIIVVDDCSSDNTCLIINNLKNRYDFKFVQRESIGGYSKSKNDGYREISNDSKYVLFHRSGDISYSNKINCLVEYLESNDSYCAIGSFVNYIDNNELIDFKNFKSTIYNNKVDLDYRSILYSQIKYNNINPSTCLIKRDICDKFVPFKYKFLGEYDFWNRLLIAGYKIKNVDSVFGNNILYDEYHRSIDIDSNIMNMVLEKEKSIIIKEYNDFLISMDEKREKKNIGIVIIGTNNYFNMVPNLISSIRKHFLTFHNVKIFLFTNKDDKISEDEDLIVTHIEHLTWPGMTLLRYDIILKNKILFKEIDYLFYIDADMIIVGDIGDEILGNITVVQHPIYYKINNRYLEYERNEKSTAYIPYGKGYNYYYGCFQGGFKDSYLEMVEFLKYNIDKDIKNGIIAKWFDESHLNRYCYENPPDNVLDPSYSSCGLDNLDYIQRFNLKIIDVEKNNDSIRNWENQEDFLNSRKKEIIKNNICLVPWLQVSMSSIGIYCNCCMSTISYGSIKNNLLGDIWNGNKIKEVRRKFMVGEIPEGCLCCFNMEKEGILSFRESFNREYIKYYDDVISKTDLEGNFSINKVKTIEIKYGNICNCKCRMCGHYCSNYWYKDALAMNYGLIDEEKIINIDDSKDLEIKIGSFLDKNYTNRISFLGGEPLINKCNNDVLRYLLDKGMKTTSIQFFSNLSSVTEEFLSIIKEFDDVIICVSIDGIGIKHDYIRGHNGLWELVVKNFKKIQELKNCIINISPCFSAYNAYHLPDLLLYIIENEMVENDRILITPLIDKDFMKASILPKSFRNKCLERFKYVENKCGKIKRIYDMCISMLSSIREDNFEQLVEFYNFTYKLDKLRGENLIKVFPEHLEIMNTFDIYKYEFGEYYVPK